MSDTGTRDMSSTQDQYDGARRPLDQDDLDLLERVAETEELGDLAQRMIECNEFVDEREDR